jgi:hypothetical protein
MNMAIQPYRRESVPAKGETRQSRLRSDSLCAIQRSVPAEKSRNSPTFEENDYYLDSSRQIAGQLDSGRDAVEDVKGIFARKYEQARVAHEVYGRTPTFSVTI